MFLKKNIISFVLSASFHSMIVAFIIYDEKPIKSDTSMTIVNLVESFPSAQLKTSSKINKNLSWKSSTTISDGLEKTFLWYLNNQNYFNSLKKNQIIKRLGKL